MSNQLMWTQFNLVYLHDRKFEFLAKPHIMWMYQKYMNFWLPYNIQWRRRGSGEEGGGGYTLKIQILHSDIIFERIVCIEGSMYIREV